MARVQGRRSRITSGIGRWAVRTAYPPPGLARWVAPGQGAGVTHSVGRGVHRHRVAPGRRVHYRARHRPLPRTAVRFQHLSQGEGGMPGPRLRGRGAAASARGVQVASGELGRGPCGPVVRTRDKAAASRERSAASRGRGWVTECWPELGFCLTPATATRISSPRFEHSLCRRLPLGIRPLVRGRRSWRRVFRMRPAAAPRLGDDRVADDLVEVDGPVAALLSDEVAERGAGARRRLDSERVLVNSAAFEVEDAVCLSGQWRCPRVRSQGYPAMIASRIPWA